MRSLWRIWGRVERKYSTLIRDSRAVVVIGFQRSGTSLVSQLVNRAGVYFGEKENMKRVDPRNPQGFFEYEPLFRISRAMLRQAGYKTEIDIYTHRDLRAKGLVGRLRRAVSRRNLLKIFASFSRGNRLWGFKSFPLSFYLFKHYLGDYKLVGIYREPHAAAQSIMKAWGAGRFTYPQALRFWTEANKNMLYHLADAPDSILVKYEDLIDEGRRGEILEKLVDFIRVESKDDLNSVITHKLNRSTQKAVVIEEIYPLSLETQEVLERLERTKI